MDFNAFAEYLFHLINPLPKSIMIDIDFGSEHDGVTTWEFLYELFAYGYKSKFRMEPITEEEGLRRLEHLKMYFEAVGFKLILVDYVKSADSGLVTNFSVKFEPLV